MRQEGGEKLPSTRGLSDWPGFMGTAGPESASGLAAARAVAASVTIQRPDRSIAGAIAACGFVQAILPE